MVVLLSVKIHEVLQIERVVFKILLESKKLRVRVASVRLVLEVDDKQLVSLVVGEELELVLDYFAVRKEVRSHWIVVEMLVLDSIFRH